MSNLRHPRTLQEAFGPHTSGQIHEARDPNERKHWLLYAVAVVAVLVLVRAVA